VIYPQLSRMGRPYENICEQGLAGKTLITRAASGFRFIVLFTIKVRNRANRAF